MTPKSLQSLILTDAHLFFGEAAEGEDWREFSEMLANKIMEQI